MRIGIDSTFLSLLVPALYLSCATGCGSSGTTFPVTGQVVYVDGTTLPTGGQVIFESTAPGSTVLGRGFFGTDGDFQLTKFTDAGNGLPSGDYAVAIICNIPDDRGNMSPKEYLKASNPVDKRFKSPHSSGLRFTISAETAPHEFRLEVHPPRRR